jgi:hypothetical protein
MSDFLVDADVAVTRVFFPLLANDYAVIAQAQLNGGHQAARAGAKDKHVFSWAVEIDRGSEKLLAML